MDNWYLDGVVAPSEKHRNKALAWQNQLTKPAGSLGRLESLAVELAALQHNLHPSAARVAMAVFAADQGVCAESVSAFPQAVTAQMVANFAGGGAAISVLAKSLGASLEVINLGTVQPTAALPQVIDATIAPQSGNIARAAAMTHEQLQLALAAGRAAVQRAQANNTDLFVAGEMGIGNTTTATAMLCRLLEVDPALLAGPGTGLDSAGVSHKARVIEQALNLHAQARDPVEVLRCLGGFETAALVGAYIACAQTGIAVLVDGFICTAAALLASRINPAIVPWLILSHASAEPGHRLAVEAMGQVPLLDLGLRLGEGSGAAVAVPLVRLACDLHNGMATFAEAGVADKAR
ncbi:nicotinate-nucleotide--dimethylbenzimidazole phosphoribosyltransferase [Simiduia agarivorans]|uniref:Nicotinate-nucleotide--dimethylbenzimidazole phosphoribosyltransferase n=1 Tax=Simiduia agarivorans (strain DSM 21679 / JCM 13881 / BCRC 17597 / SA1) TaxID=1117647 RepID=K4KJW6_SIMAS|nr:nicotinate-nucleotide--dimethylbenzimidazole phosphoribosyltransferase [Simiduia agarivorans]AFU99286.1 nicotinate-nucleotide--dimethylbenzimidazole phosphoribosyltransferase [Simiduia agarivorans SA1 = DSM 21679]